ncbi:MAG: DUF4215 domain-containing protein [Candidatus Peregrinibacteria bacterium]
MKEPLVIDASFSTDLDTITFSFSQDPGTQNEIRYEVYRVGSDVMLGGGAVGTQGDPSVITGFRGQLDSYGAGSYRIDFAACPRPPMNEAPNIDATCGPRVSKTINYVIPSSSSSSSVSSSSVPASRSTCGNSVTEAGEQCDDGNSVDDDDCTNSCTLRVTPPSDGIYVLDNSDPRFFVIHKNNFQDHGNGMMVDDRAAYNGSYHSLLNVTMVGWKYGGTFGTPEYRTLPGGTYDVYATWQPSGGYTSVMFTAQLDLVLPSGGRRSAIAAVLDQRVNQTVAPSGATFRGQTWKHIGSVTFEGNREVKVLAKPMLTNDRFGADAVAFKARAPVVTSSSASSVRSSSSSGFTHKDCIGQDGAIIAVPINEPCPTFSSSSFSSVSSAMSSASSTPTGRAICGNGVKEGSEQCDDGNRYNQDGCNVECRIDTPLQPLSGICEPCSECDRTSAGCYVYTGNDPAILRDIINPACKQSPSTYHATTSGWRTCRQPPVRGNGRLEGQEECDDGNTVDGDGCGAYGNREPKYYCPSCEGVTCPTGKACYVTRNGSPTCLSINSSNPSWYRCRDCGNGRPDAGEECDDGNTVNGDACTNECTRAKCGDGVIWNGHEYCDDGNTANGDGCGSTCQDCACSPACSYGQSCFISLVGNAPHCGAPTSTGEVSGGYWDICPTCGNGAREKNETCDDGRLNGTSNHCNTNCNGRVAARCGNGVVESSEQCDDGNQSNTDACLNTCRYAACGDGFIRAGIEQCDDGNRTQGDGCNAGCQIEVNGSSASNAGKCTCSPACPSTQSCYVHVSGRAVCSTPGLSVNGWSECTGGGGGSPCPSPPSCVAPSQGCSYRNLVYNSNGCLISCGPLACTRTTTGDVCDQCQRTACASNQSCYANSNTSRTPVCSVPNLPNVSASGWTECKQGTSGSTNTIKPAVQAPTTSGTVCNQCQQVSCTSSQSCYANSNTARKPVCAPKNISGVAASGWTECR